MNPAQAGGMSSWIRLVKTLLRFFNSDHVIASFTTIHPNTTTNQSNKVTTQSNPPLHAHLHLERTNVVQTRYNVHLRMTTLLSTHDSQRPNKELDCGCTSMFTSGKIHDGSSDATSDADAILEADSKFVAELLLTNARFGKYSTRGKKLRLNL